MSENTGSIREIDFDDEECGSDDIPYSLIEALKRRRSGDDVKIIINDGGIRHNITDNFNVLSDQVGQDEKDNDTGKNLEEELEEHEEKLDKIIAKEWCDRRRLNGGSSIASYAWEQTMSSSTIWLPIPCDIKSSTIRIGLKECNKDLYRFDVDLEGDVDPRLEGLDQDAQAQRNINPSLCDELIIVNYNKSDGYQDPNKNGKFKKEKVMWRGKLGGTVRGESALRDWELLREVPWIDGRRHVDLVKLELKKAISAPSQCIDMSSPAINEYALINWWSNGFKSLCTSLSEDLNIIPDYIRRISIDEASIDVGLIPERIQRMERIAKQRGESNPLIDVHQIFDAHRMVKEQQDFE